jgi:hypothetical protein
MEDDYEPMPDELLRARPSDPIMYALADAHVRRSITRAQALAEFIQANPHLFAKPLGGQD